MCFAKMRLKLSLNVVVLDGHNGRDDENMFGSTDVSLK